ncbi:calcium/sodium antiporter [Brumimicrobium aurantiacum]|uniref:Sodium:calcium antiporter n=1 Tax=Brumimicrobium aurantiacum TaxID=1737063 RepID=A0A3E1EYY3_9FLAO|nr:calcium/sodium antiporter [Brumimicrobium aurantiacum]RFC54758.1 sodium:calcium antiporter [Brumimicrobium aurantiacum]
MLFNLLLIIIGLVLLIAGGESLVKGAVGIAAKARLSKLVIGMTVVSFGTSSPELLVSLQSAHEGLPEIAIGNVIGSNIANIALVLGVTVLIFPMPVARNTIRYDWPMMMIASVLFYLFAFDLEIQRWEGILMFVSLIAFIIFIIVQSRKSNKVESLDMPEIEEKPNNISIAKNIFFLVLGLIGLYFGSYWLIKGAKSIAVDLGVSQHVIGITIIAFGTSVPELATSCVAAYRKETDISVGNLIGSNIFNILAVLGLTSIVSPIAVKEFVLSWDLLWMIGIAILMLPMMLVKRKVGRLSGAILLAIYITYIVTLF